MDLATMLDGVLKVVADVAVIAGMASILISLKSIRKAVEDSERQYADTRVRNSIEVLSVFSNEIIPKMGRCSDRYADIVERRRMDVVEETRRETGDQTFSKEDVPEELDSLIVIDSQLEAGCGHVLNELEQVCAYMRSGTVAEDLVYRPLHCLLIGFVSENAQALQRLREGNVPYGNLMAVAAEWRNREEREEIDGAQALLERKRRKYLDTEDQSA